MREMAGKLSLRALYALFASVSLLSVLCSADAVSDLATKGRPAIDAAIAQSTTCTKAKLRVRREWYSSHLMASLYRWV
jgi:tyrosinase